MVYGLISIVYGLSSMVNGLSSKVYCLSSMVYGLSFMVLLFLGGLRVGSCTAMRLQSSWRPRAVFEILSVVVALGFLCGFSPPTERGSQYANVLFGSLRFLASCRRSEARITADSESIRVKAGPVLGEAPCRASATISSSRDCSFPNAIPASRRRLSRRPARLRPRRHGLDQPLRRRVRHPAVRPIRPRLRVGGGPALCARGL